MNLAINGFRDDRFAGVEAAFAANFTAAPEGLDELGARFSVFIHGEPVIDLYAGHADTAKTVPFSADTLTPVFSTGKAVMSLMIARLVDKGRLDYDAPVADIWPAFGQAGKEAITLGQMMSHQAGLPGFSAVQPPEIWFDHEAVLETLAAQAPLWPPGTASGYHPITIGYLAGEVFRRADGRTMGTALREDFGQPFGLDLWIGLPDAEHGRVAQLRKPAAPPDLGPVDAIKKAAFLDRGSAPGGRGSAEWRRMEIPSANMHARADSLARIMGVLANEGRLANEGLGDQAILRPETVETAIRERIHGPDRVLPFTLSWAVGYTRNAGLNVFGPGPRTVGHYGWGGSCAFADPDTGVSAAYVMTRQSPHLIGDPRALRLFEALYAAL